MRYFEFVEPTGDADKQRIAAQKKHADSQLQAAKRAKQKAKQAELTLKQRQTADALKKLNASKP